MGKCKCPICEIGEVKSEAAKLGEGSERQKRRASRGGRGVHVYLCRPIFNSSKKMHQIQMTGLWSASFKPHAAQLSRWTLPCGTMSAQLLCKWGRENIFIWSESRLKEMFFALRLIQESKSLCASLQSIHRNQVCPNSSWLCSRTRIYWIQKEQNSSVYWQL